MLTVSILGDRLTVGHRPLEAGIGVRIPVPQPSRAEFPTLETGLILYPAQNKSKRTTS